MGWEGEGREVVQGFEGWSDVGVFKPFGFVVETLEVEGEPRWK